MTSNYRHLLAIACCTGFLGTGCAVLADADDVRALQAARITLIEAIQVAEATQPGKAYDASIEDDKPDQPEYEIKIVAEDGREFEVIVNGLNGDVISTQAD